MIRYLLAFVLGVWLFQPQPRLPDSTLFALYAAVGVCALGVRWCRLPAWLVFGFAWAHGHALLTRPADLPTLDPTRPMWAEGTVDSLVEADRLRTRFALRVDSLEQDGQRFPGDWRLRVSWYRDAPTLLPGERWRLRLKLRPLWGYHNGGGFDYERWLYSQGIRYAASVQKDAATIRLTEATGASLTAWRQALSHGMASLDDGGRGSALLRALVVGDRGGFVQRDWQAFAATGTNHLVAISGLHIGLMAGLVGGLVAWAWRRVPRLCRRWPALSAAALAGGATALLYAGLAGFAIPTQRALLMLGIAMGALLGGRMAHPWRTLALALAVVVAWSPMAVTEAGLWLSFAAVAVILLAVGTERRPVGRLRQWTRLQLAVGVGLIPLLLLYFQQASLVAPLVNLLMVPWFSLVLVPLALLATLVWLLVPSIGEAAWHGWLWLANPTIELLGQVAEWSWASVAWPLPGPAALGLAMVGVLLWLAPRGLPARWTLVPLLLPLATAGPARPPPGAFDAHLLDVGQGLGVVVQTAAHVLVFDAGPRFRSGFNTGDTVLLPFLRRQGISTVDTLVASHANSDHVGGVPALQHAVTVHRLLAGEPDELPGSDQCGAGQTWVWDGVRFDVLSPSFDAPWRGNNASCVLRVTGAGGSLLLTGDIEKEAEQALLAAGQLAPMDVVVAPHHGSRTSSTSAFVATLRPAHVLYATGYRNRWGFPKPDVATRWRDAGAQSWDTARDGAVSIRFADGREPLQVRVARRHHYWQP